MEQAMLKGGIVGCGIIANRSHMPVWRALKNVEIVAACDQNEDAAMATAKRFAIPRAYGDLSHMLEKESLDFVDICTPPTTHSQLSIQAMEAGLHVLVEKPMALSVSEADEMILAAEANRVKLCVVANFLFTPVVQKAKDLLNAGLIGDLVAVDVEVLAFRGGAISRQDHWCHDLPWGILNEYAPHPAYLQLAFLGNIHSVKAIAKKYSEFPWVTADELKVLLESEKGIGSFTISCSAPRDSFTLNVLGTTGKLHLDNLALTMTRSRYRGNRVDELVLDQLNLSFQLLAGVVSSSVRVFLGRRYYKAGHQGIIQKFVESIRDNLDPPFTGEDGRETIRVLEEIWKQIAQPEKGKEC